MTFLSRQSLRRQVLAAAGLLVVLLAVLIIWAGGMSWRDRSDELAASAESVAHTVSASLDQYLVSLTALATALEQHPAVRTRQADAARALFATVMRRDPLVRNIVLVDAEGRVVASTTNLTSQGASLPIVSEALRTGQPVISQVFVGPFSNRPAAAVAMPLLDDAGATVGVLGFGLELERLPRLFSETSVADGGVVTVVDRVGRVVARNQDPARLVGADGSALLPASRSQVRDLDGIDRIGAQAPIVRAGWRVVVTLPTSLAQSRIRRNWIRNVALLTLWVSAALGLTLWGAIYTSSRLSGLRTLAQRIADGNLDAPVDEPMPNLELAHLQEAFAAMATRLRQAREAHERQVRHERQMNSLLQSMQRQALRQERLAAVGQLVSGVAHEINNPLQAILGSSEILQRQQGLPPAAREEGAFIQAQAIRMREIVRSLARFSDPRLSMAEPVDLREVVAEVQQLRAREQDAAGVAFAVDNSSKRLVHAGFADLTQVLLNLVINAEQALQQSPVPGARVVVRILDVDRRVRCEVEDNGPGVRVENEARLFQPFFTTRDVGDGSGLGLAISYGIVRSFGGTIGYFRNPAGGATFYFELPAMMADEHGNDSTALLRLLDPPRV